MTKSKSIILLISCSLVFLLVKPVFAETNSALLYHQSSKAEPISGSKEALIKAIRAGHKIRLYMNLGLVEHSMDAGFISIFRDEVYAQINHIKGQRPNRETGVIELREREHIGLYSTKDKYEIKWFID